jgi:predicted nucleic acid-binding protein
MTVFIDTSGFLAMLNVDDRFHGLAQDIWQTIIEQEETLVCNNYILIETFALLQSRFGLEATQVFQDDVVPNLNIYWVESELHERAVSALLAARRRRLSLVDCSAMETMRALSVKRVFTFDRHFDEYGFDCLPRQPLK